MEERFSNYTKLSQNPSSNLWIIFSIFTLLSGALGQFILGFQQDYPYQLNFSMTLSQLLSGLFIFFSKFLKPIALNNSFPSLKDIVNYNSCKCVLLLISGGIFAYCGNFFNTFAWYIQPESQGIFQVIISCNTCLSAILALWFFKQKLMLVQAVGILVVFLGLVIISLNFGEKMSGSLIGILVALVSMVFMSLRNICGKASKNQGANVSSVILSANLVFFVCGVIMVVVQTNLGYDYINTEFNYCRGILGSAFIVASFNFGMIAINIGKVGPAMAIGNNTPVILLVLNGVFRGFLPPVIKLVGCAVVTFGILVTVLGPVFQKRKSEERQACEISLIEGNQRLLEIDREEMTEDRFQRNFFR